MLAMRARMLLAWLGQVAFTQVSISLRGQVIMVTNLRAEP